MTTHETESRQDLPSKSLANLIAVCTEVLERRIAFDPVSLMALSEEEQQAICNELTKYATFEFNQLPECQGLPIKVTGNGFLLVSETDGTLLGGEIISHGDTITGELDEVCTYVVPTAESLTPGASEVPILGQMMSPVLLLKNGVYKTGMNSDGKFELEYDLSQYQLGIPTQYMLDVASNK